MDPEEEEKLDDALKEVLQSVPGCSVDKQTIKDMLWDSYYDVDAAIAYCVDKTAKAQKVEQMKKEQIDKKSEYGLSTDFLRVPETADVLPLGVTTNIG